MSDATPTLSADGDDELARRMRRAIRAVRREGYKVAVIYAVVDAALATLAVNLGVQLLAPPWLPADLPIPSAVVAPLGSLLGRPLGAPTVETAAVVGVGVGLLVFAAEAVFRTRRPLVEQFENANPEVREALRTARDSVEADRRTRMTLDLYEDVLERLRRASSLDMLHLPRVLVTLVLVVAVSLASIQVAVVDLQLRGDGPDADTTTRPQSEYEGLQDPDSVLGDPEDVSAGQEELDAEVASEGEGSQETGSDAPTAYDQSGFESPSAVESQQAGFAPGEQLEEAELIREYNLKIRDERDE